MNGLYGFELEECIYLTIEHIRKHSLLNIFLCKTEYKKCVKTEFLQSMIQITNIQVFPKPCYMITNTNNGIGGYNGIRGQVEEKETKKRGRPPSTPLNLTNSDLLNSNKKRGRPPKQKIDLFQADDKPIREKMKARKSTPEYDSDN
jgi:hypothetical protein